MKCGVSPQLSYVSAKVSEVKEALQLLNSLDSDESDVEFAVLSPDASELTDEGDENEVNIGFSGYRNHTRKSDKPRVPFRSKSVLKKQRGTSGFAFDENSSIFLVPWNDNNTVTVARNFSTLEPFFYRENTKLHKFLQQAYG
ncbi:hypothetical protein TNCT_725781 [Trichonephila clavata]|uniref:Uncharacterized protein n=1 Tax=Trichonephila clavata TaxID=2740835 RepID=A0A8X6HW02_TRICU|nr:hypothetical protein TNCT_725781 [Trichonephila clavata]